MRTPYAKKLLFQQPSPNVYIACFIFHVFWNCKSQISAPKAGEKPVFGSTEEIRTHLEGLRPPDLEVLFWEGLRSGEGFCSANVPLSQSMKWCRSPPGPRETQQHGFLLHWTSNSLMSNRQKCYAKIKQHDDFGSNLFGGSTYFGSAQQHTTHCAFTTSRL